MSRQVKVQSLDMLIRVRGNLQLKSRKIVFTNGCFDIIHRGHIHLFRRAKRLGDVLVAAVNDDESVRRLKGSGRPVFPLRERLEVLSALEDIDYLVPFSQDTPRCLIERIQPDILVKGGDWRPEEVVGKDEVEAAGGKVVIIPYLPGRSTTEIIQKIREISQK
ncbi:MAG: D-glycero-beta-D-manno-heptose 1-phosphate adenylyltransferase [Candidatus Aminicenantes bacterium]